MYEILAAPAPPGVLTLHAVHATFDDRNGRTQAGDLEFAIEAKREQYDERPGMACRAKFRLSRISQGTGRLVLELGPTDYFDYLATNHDADLNSALVEFGIATHADPDACLSNAIGNLAVVETTDGQIAALERSTAVATFAGRVDLPGGHPEPADVDADLEDDSAVTAELFDAIRREVSDELGIDEELLEEPALLGIIRNFEDGRKPEMIFHVPVPLSADELLRTYEAAADRYESRALLLGTPQELRRRGITMTMPSHAALDLWTGRHCGGAG